MAKHPVLLVEDDQDSREALVTLLGIAGYPVISATDGEEALHALRGGLKPCAIVLDLFLPGVDGWHVLDQLKTMPDWRDIPIIVLSGQDIRPADMAARLGIPVDHCFLKPSDPEELARVISRHCGS